MKNYIYTLISLLCVFSSCKKDEFPTNMNEMFPDDVFRKYVMFSFDRNLDCIISHEEASAVTEISFNAYSAPHHNKEILSIQGVEYFVNLKILEVNSIRGYSSIQSNLVEINLTQNLALEVLHCPHNQIRTLDLRYNKNLKSLICDKNKLTSLDLRANTLLTTLSCTVNNLIKLELSSCLEMVRLYCNNNKLVNLDVMSCRKLEILNCSNNQLETLNFSSNKSLTGLSCDNNKLTTLDISSCMKLNSVMCRNNANLNTIWVWDDFFDKEVSDFYKDSHSEYVIKK